MKTTIRTVAIIVIIVAVIAASLFAAHIPPLWPPFTVSVLVLAAALFVLRHVNKESYSGADNPQNPFNRFRRLLEEQFGFLQQFNENSELDTGLLEDRLEHQFTEVESLRTGLVEFLGMARYVAVFTPFAQAERLQYRGLSAALDGYSEEARKSLLQAQKHLREALSQIKQTV